MSAEKRPDEVISFDRIQGLTEALAGANAEGIDLGPRGEHIRQLGRSLEAMIEALRIKLANLSHQGRFDGTPLDLDRLSRMAQAARTYGLSKSA